MSSMSVKAADGWRRMVRFPLPSIPQQILFTVNSDNFSVVVNVDIDGFALGICEAAISDSRPSTTVNILCSGIPCFHNVCIGELLSLQ